MDDVSHALLGAATGFVLFGGKLGRHAAGLGALAAIAPDADVLISSDRDPLLAVEYHRHFTHAIAFAPIGSLLVAALWFAWQKFRPQWQQLWGCSLAAYLTHPFLDTCTTYGTQLLRPFSDARFSWDLISIIDPIFTVALLFGVIAMLIKRQPRFAIASMLFCLGYLGFGGWQHHRAQSAQAALAQVRGHTITRSRLMPTLANNVVWRSLYEYQGRVYSDRIRVGWLSPPTVCEGASLPLVKFADLTPAEVKRNGEGRYFERLAWFADGWVTRSPADATVIGDVRYSMSAQTFDPIWGIRFTSPDAPIAIEWAGRSRNRQVEVSQIWREIIGESPDYRALTTISRNEKSPAPGQ